jgi:hypothetical protein
VCCFSAPTEVHATRIFARALSPGVQALVYQMQYVAAAPTAMILPLPVGARPTDASVRWKSLKDRPTFFEQLAKGFPEQAPRPWFPSKSATAAATESVPVHEVGDFVASFVPTIDDFSRIDPRFVIKREVWSAIPEYSDYGFAVFQLKEPRGSPHPIALEFDTRLEGKLFFPTVHIHDGTVHPQDVFDHVLYLQEGRFDRTVHEYAGPSKEDGSTGFVRSKGAAASFFDLDAAMGLLDGQLLVHRKELSGLLPNKDTLVSLAPAAAKLRSASCAPCSVGVPGRANTLGAPGIALAALSWVIRRRNDRGRS